MERICGVAILAGGEGRRMGGDKPFKLLLGKPLLIWVYEALAPLGLTTYLSVRTFEDGVRMIELIESFGFPTAGLEIVRDLVPFRGPLAGLWSLVAGVGEEEFLVATCDQPFLKTCHFQRLFETKGGNKVVVYLSKVEIEPFPLKFPRSMGPLLSDYLAYSPKPSMKGFLSYLETKENLCKIRIKEKELIYFQNINTSDELIRARDVQL